MGSRLAAGDHPFATHLNEPHGSGQLDACPHSGASGGVACGDLVRVGVRVEEGLVAEAAFEAEGCAPLRAAASAVAEMAEGAPVLEAARIAPADVAEALGGLTPPARHGADLAVDALHRALGSAARAGDIRLAPSAGRTLVAMSGGVDSAVAARLALDAGDEVVAVTLELWADPATDGTLSCCSPQALLGARALAHSMGLPHLTLDLRTRFRAEVVDNFLSEHAAGRTPNPCVRCNGLVRFDAMLDLAESIGAARLATGHYARIVRDEAGPLVAVARDPKKDQSYMLARLDTATLERLAFPLGDLDKPQVRELARDAQLPVAEKRESQDLCFLAGSETRSFLRRHGQRRRAGELVTEDGAVVGRHDGQERFTVGQRRGIGVAAPEPLYVVGKDARRNRVVVGPRSSLVRRRVEVRDAHLHRGAEAVESVKLRYRSRPLACRVTSTDGPALELELADPADSVAPGQVACLMAGDRVVGYGTIGEARDG